MNTNNINLNILIIDDEKKACANLQQILVEYIDPDINIVGQANNTTEAEAQIARYIPDAVFLDIEMPNENAFQFLERISPVKFEVIFVTAYDEYAVKAFKLNAVDYILKPISINELKNAVNKLREKLKYKQIIANNETYYTEISKQVKNKSKAQKITLRDNNSMEVVNFNNIHFLEAQSSYCRIVFTKDNVVREMIMSCPLSDYEELLPSDIFYRIHRSFLINCGHVKKIMKDDSYQIVIDGNFTLPVSRRRYQPLLEFLQNNEYNYE